MRKLSLTVIILLITGFSGLSAQTDTLSTVSSFDAPSTHLWGVTYDGTNLWISESHPAKIFKMNTQGNVLDSFDLERQNITGITFVNDSLWVLSSVPTSDSTINGTNYPVYPVYHVNKNTGEILDSLNTAPEFSSSYSLWGLCEKDDYFYISVDGGFGPSMLKINRFTGSDTILYAQVKGMTVISDSIWAVSYFDKEISITNGTNMNVKYYTTFRATDLTYDGNNFWMTDTAANKIKKIEAVNISGLENNVPNNELSVFPNPAGDHIRIETGNVRPEGILKIFNEKGKLIRQMETKTCQNSQKINVSGLQSGMYIITLEGKQGNSAIRFVKQ